jgi:RimJ/RimL family protein N-acetyltransferase
MEWVCLHEREPIAEFCRRDIALHLYTIGDLDPFFWSYTTWYALMDGARIEELVLLYNGTAIPTIIALTPNPDERMAELLHDINHLLPRHFYAHLSGQLSRVLEQDYEQWAYGPHLKMMLRAPERLQEWDVSTTSPLTMNDLPAIQALYTTSYPSNWFDQGDLVSIAGVHVYSEQYRAAAIGNITTHPDHRGRGYATRVLARLCRELLPTADAIGLNVKADNTAALDLYRRIGFEPAATYDESEFMLKPQRMLSPEI